MNGPLAGIRIVDLTTMVSGPLATMTLADQGADVIKVESPAGDYSRSVATRRGGVSASFANNNRNKRSIVLDLKRDEAVAVLRRIVRTADVFVQNFRPGVAERMGLGEAVLRAEHPRLVYVSIAGFGFTGPYRDKPVFDPLIQALSGLATVQAGSDAARPRLVRTILPDKLTAIQAAQAIAAALFARERSGVGQHVRLSMLDTVVAFLWSSDMGGHTFVGDEPAEERAQSFIDLIYETADGYASIATMQDKHWTGFANAVDRPALAHDPRFDTAEKRELNKDERTALIQELVRSHRTNALIERLEAFDVPCAPVLDRTRMRNHPQVRANGLLIEYDHPRAGRLRQARSPAVFDGVAAAAPRPAPALGEHGEQVLAESGFSRDEIERLLGLGVLRRPEPGV